MSPAVTLIGLHRRHGMNREEVLLELDVAEGRFRPGDAIAGRVRVGPATTSFGRPLVVAVWWETTGAGDVDQGAERVIELAARTPPSRAERFPSPARLRPVP